MALVCGEREIWRAVLTCLRDADHIGAREDGGDGVGLNRRGHGVAHLLRHDLLHDRVKTGGVEL
jgi:hypothetical protein